MTGTTCLPLPTSAESRFHIKCGKLYFIPSTSKKYSVQKYVAVNENIDIQTRNLNQ